MTDKTTETFLSAIQAVVDMAPQAPEATTATHTGSVRRRVTALVSGFAAVLLVAGLGIAVVALNGDGQSLGSAATPAMAECRSTDSAEMSSEVDGIPWSLSISGQLPNVSMFATIDQNQAGGMEFGGASWPSHLGGEWEWTYLADDVDVVFGKIPVDATARATLNDGTIMVLCSMGSSLGHEVAYAAGAFPRSTIIELIEVVDANGTTLGTMQLAELITSTQIDRIDGRDDGFTLGFAISIPTG